MQLSLEHELSELSKVTFCFIDLETTGGSPKEDRITEIGAVKMRGGELLGEFRTFVCSDRVIPPRIVVLTGITQSMLIDAPTEAQALSALTDFVHGTTLVGHNLRFDLGFLQSGAERIGLRAFPTFYLDTLTLSRKLLAGETPNHKLETVARYLRVSHPPSHRALDDARATAEVFHYLLERAGTIGATHLEDLTQLHSANYRAASPKLSLTTHLPHLPGTYYFRDQTGDVIYLGKATDIKTRVRGYFFGEQRRKIPRLLAETKSVTFTVSPCELMAAITEQNEIRALKPRYNAEGKHPKAPYYLRHEGHDHWAIVSKFKNTVSAKELHIGPLLAHSQAKEIARLLNQSPEIGSTLHSWCEERDKYDLLSDISQVAAALGAQIAGEALRLNFEAAEVIRQASLTLLKRLYGAILLGIVSETPGYQLLHRSCSVGSHSLHNGTLLGDEILRDAPMFDAIWGRQPYPQDLVPEILILQTHLLQGTLTHERLSGLTRQLPVAKLLEGFLPKEPAQGHYDANVEEASIILDRASKAAPFATASRASSTPSSKLPARPPA